MEGLAGHNRRRNGFCLEHDPFPAWTSTTGVISPITTLYSWLDTLPSNVITTVRITQTRREERPSIQEEGPKETNGFEMRKSSGRGRDLTFTSFIWSILYHVGASMVAFRLASNVGFADLHFMVGSRKIDPFQYFSSLLQREKK